METDYVSVISIFYFNCDTEQLNICHGDLVRRSFEHKRIEQLSQELILNSKK